jgi:hypothetical protein
MRNVGAGDEWLNQLKGGDGPTDEVMCSEMKVSKREE